VRVLPAAFAQLCPAETGDEGLVDSGNVDDVSAGKVGAYLNSAVLLAVLEAQQLGKLALE
jgi:hypothetical protein